MEKYKAIGLMSGSSLDGLDIAYCGFSEENGKWDFDILKTEVIAYPDEWTQEIKGLPVSNAKNLWEVHAALGNYFGEQVTDFIKRNSLTDAVDLVASHGHTIFHFPEKKFTTQIGDGSAIAARSNLPVICDFRSADIADGGQGTPIVPIGDLMLFPNHRFCLNIGGIANMSCKTGSADPSNPRRIIAFDLCAANQVLNSLANRLGKEYDAEGKAAAKGKLNKALLKRLNGLPFYEQSYPKSLDNSFSREVIFPLLEEFDISIEDKLNTYTEHVAWQVKYHINMIAGKEKIDFGPDEKMLVTGGGTFSKYLIERIKELAGVVVEVPNDELVKFKEAVVIAFMGVLRMRNEVNVLKSVTGASKDSVSGAVYRP
jgi:anhydro-N-acetylmuramic acid kinase